jgi:hypothetical protein
MPAAAAVALAINIAADQIVRCDPDRGGELDSNVVRSGGGIEGERT